MNYCVMVLFLLFGFKSFAGIPVMKCQSVDPEIRAQVEVLKTTAPGVAFDQFQMNFAYDDGEFEFETTVKDAELFRWFNKKGAYVFSLDKAKHGLTIAGDGRISLVGPMCDDPSDPDTCIFGVEYVELSCEILEDLGGMKFHPWEDYSKGSGGGL